MVKKSTKIVATIGPTSDSKEILSKLYKEGMDVARLNFSHGTYPYFEKLISTIKEVSDDIAILLDTKGPEIRTGEIKDGETYLKEKSELKVSTQVIVGDDHGFTIHYKKLLELDVGTKVLIDDGLIECEVIKKSKVDLTLKVLNGGNLGSKKTVSLQGHIADLDFISKKDKEDILFGIKQDVDFVAASFVRTPEDVKQLRNLLDKNSGSHIHIISKIEHPLAVENIDEIIALSEGIMVARGDLGVEVPLYKVPEIQENIIRKCNLVGKPVIVATQMLESMKSNPRPTRAEVNDVAQAIMQGSDAIMLSGETAGGKYPVKSVQMMTQIAQNYDSIAVSKAHVRNKHYFGEIEHSISTFITKSAYEASCNLPINALLIPTESGFSARQVSKFRPGPPIYALAYSRRIMRQLRLSWGVYPILNDDTSKLTKDLIHHSIMKCYDEKVISKKDKVVITAGHILRDSGHSNILEIFNVKDILDSSK
jgi:pyruvate kinase